MHPEVLEWVGRWATHSPIEVLDLGGRDVNGTCRPLFPNAEYITVDIEDGPGVDIVADAATWEPDRGYDLVLSTEVFEHTAVWLDICVTAYRACKPGGRFIVTCAGPNRQPHSGIDGLGVRPGEHYKNLDVAGLRGGFETAGFGDIHVEQVVRDLRGTARRNGWL